MIFFFQNAIPKRRATAVTPNNILPGHERDDKLLTWLWRGLQFYIRSPKLETLNPKSEAVRSSYSSTVGVPMILCIETRPKEV